MPSGTRKTVAIDLPLGSASDYDRTMFPVLRVKGTLNKGDLYLQATLEEILNIRKMAKYIGGYDQFLRNTKTQYDQLTIRLEELQNQPSTYNPFKFIANQREIRLFYEAGKVLYRTTKKTSDEMKRDLASYDSTDVTVPEGSDVSPDETISGLAIQGDLDEVQSLLMEMASIHTNPFADPLDATDFDDHAPLLTESSITPDTASTSVGSGTQSSSGPVFHIFNINHLHHSSSTVSGVDVSNPTGSVVIQAGISESNKSRIQSFDSSTSATST